MSLPNRLYDSTGPIACSLNLHDAQLTPRSGEALAIGGYIIANRSNANADVGLFERFPNAFWSAGRIQANATPDFVGIDSGAKSVTANAFINVFTTTNNDGFLIQCAEKFHAFSCIVNDEGSGGAFAYQYYNGSAMVNVTPIQAASFATGSAAKTQAIFAVPSDWTKGTTAAVGTSNANAYAIQVLATTAPGSVVSISDVRVYRMLDFFPQITNNNQLVDELTGSEIRLHTNASVTAYFGGTANAANYVDIDWRALSRQV